MANLITLTGFFTNKSLKTGHNTTTNNNPNNDNYRSNNKLNKKNGAQMLNLGLAKKTGSKPKKFFFIPIFNYRDWGVWELFIWNPKKGSFKMAGIFRCGLVMNFSRRFRFLGLNRVRPRTLKTKGLKCLWPQSQQKRTKNKYIHWKKRSQAQQRPIIPSFSHVL